VVDGVEGGWMIAVVDEGMNPRRGTKVLLWKAKNIAFIYLNP